jgi:prophage tail gpP-like protein
MMRIQINNINYENFKQIELNASLENAARDFSFTTVAPSFNDLPFIPGDQVKILVNGQQRILGSIEKMRYGTASNEFRISGRSTTANLIDSTIDHRVQFRGKVSLQTVANTLVKYLLEQPLPPEETSENPAPGFINSIDPLAFKAVVDEGVEDYLDDEDLEEELGQTYFEVLEKFARKRQLMVTTNGNGDLVFTRGKGRKGATPFKIIHRRSNSENNNVKTMDAAYDISMRYNIYDANSQPAKGYIRKITDITPENLIIGDGRVIDPAIQVSRKMFFVPENSSNDFECQNRSIWEAIHALSQFLRYEVTLQGHAYGENVWDSNIGVDVIDDFANIDGRLLVSSVNFSESVSGGEITRLVCRIPGAYTFPEKSLSEFLKEQFKNLPEGFF